LSLDFDELSGEDATLWLEQFEENLKKVLCSNAVELIVEKIKAEFMEEITF
jgi:hypothetical protein